MDTERNDPVGGLNTVFYSRPSTVAEALTLLNQNDRPTLVAGGTDFYPARVGTAVVESVLDLSDLAELRGIYESADGFRIGALTTWSQLLRLPLASLFDGLKAAARDVGGAQIQNVGTVVGNICNASPAADGIPPLLTLDAQIELASSAGTRVIPLEAFLLGNRKTALRPGELALALRVPKRQGSVRSAFLKLGARKYLVISIVMAAGMIEVDGAGKIVRARIAVGACSPVARRLSELEAALIGLSADTILADVAEPRHLKRLSPIDDVRGGAAYRMDAALTLVRRLLAELGRCP